MPPTATVNVRVADLPKVKEFFGAVADLLRGLAEVDYLLPPSVMDACDRLRQQVADMGARDIGPPPEGPAA
jgi:hypothetical protein